MEGWLTGRGPQPKPPRVRFESGSERLSFGSMADERRLETLTNGDGIRVPRRRVLVAMGALLAGCAVGVWRLVRPPHRPGEHEEVEVSSAEQAARSSHESTICPPDSILLLLAVADVIVPRFGAHPGAGELELLPRLDRCLIASPEGAEVFRRHWSSFEREIRQRVPFYAGRPDPEALHDVLAQWHLDYATESDPSLPASYFEGLRRNVLLAYYTSPAGWASVGYPGPAHTSPAATGASLG